MFFVSNNASKVIHLHAQQRPSLTLPLTHHRIPLAQTVYTNRTPSLHHTHHSFASQARADFVTKLTKMEFPALPSDVFSSAYAAAMSAPAACLATVPSACPRAVCPVFVFKYFLFA